MLSAMKEHLMVSGVLHVSLGLLLNLLLEDVLVSYIYNIYNYIVVAIYIIPHSVVESR